MTSQPECPAGIHAMIGWLIREADDRPLVRSDPDVLFDRFGVPAEARPVLKTGGRDDLYALGVHPNLIFKWLMWSGRSTMQAFDVGYFMDRR